MTYLQAYDALSSDDMHKREEGSFVLITQYGAWLGEDEKIAVRRIYNDAWEAIHKPEAAA